MTPILKNCRITGQPFVISDEDQVFYAKMGIPTPTLCPLERMRRRLAFRNERNLYLRKCNLTGKQIVSIYSPDKQFKVYEQKSWWSDNWDSLDYGLDFDFSKTFFEQFKALQLNVPRLSIFNQNCENSDYTNQSYDNKNCYLCAAIGNSEDLCYVQNATHLRDSIDSSFCQNSELLYGCVDTYDSYKSVCLQQCIQCSDSWFLYDCVNCNNCFGCVGLRNKQYHIWNTPYSKEDYEKKLASFHMGDCSTFESNRKVFSDHLTTLSHVCAWIKNSENVSGNNIRNSRNAIDCFDVFNLQDCRYSSWIFGCKDAYDSYGTGKSQFSVECVGAENVNHVGFCSVTSDSHNCYYTDLCFNSQDCFGCIGLKGKRYCILNKQYSKEAYELMVPKIIDHMKKTGEWGEFFPIELSPFAYNETVAQEYYPLTQEQCLDMGLKWHIKNDSYAYQGVQKHPPASIEMVADSITREIFTCTLCSKNYKIIQRELNLYRRLQIPVPIHCLECRYKTRISLRNPRSLWARTCAECGLGIQTTYSPDRPEKVLCEACYLKTVY